VAYILKDDNTQLEFAERADLRDVTSTARLFNFRRPVYITVDVWEDCVELKTGNGVA